MLNIKRNLNQNRLRKMIGLNLKACKALEPSFEDKSSQVLQRERKRPNYVEVEEKKPH